MRKLTLAGLMLFGLAGGALAEGAMPCDAEKGACPALSSGSGANASGASASGQIVFIDPDTGEIRPGDEAANEAPALGEPSFAEAMAIQMREAFSTEGLETRRTATGAVAIDLQGRFQSPLVAVIGQSGGVTIEHAHPGIGAE